MTRVDHWSSLDTGFTTEIMAVNHAVKRRGVLVPVTIVGELRTFGAAVMFVVSLFGTRLSSSAGDSARPEAGLSSERAALASLGTP
jgi:hypothetical protein